MMKELIEDLIRVSEKAGKAIMEIYGRSDRGVHLKDDKSPLTDADRKSHEIISAYLRTTGIPVLSEEGYHASYEERKNWEKLWIVDPLDGTKEFLHRNGEFTTNIALIENGEPVLGVVYAPAIDKMCWGLNDEAYIKENGTTRRLSIFHKHNNLDDLMQVPGLKVVASRSHLNPETRAFLAKLKEPEIVAMGSSLKLIMVAEGHADIYPRFAPTSEWDIAAGHAIVRAAGGNVRENQHEAELTYNKENILNPWFYCF